MELFRDKDIKSLKPKTSPYEKREGNGFTVRVQPTGTKTFYYIYKLNGRDKKIRIGEYGIISLAEAREKSGAIHVARLRGDEIVKEGENVIDYLASQYLERY